MGSGSNPKSPTYVYLQKFAAVISLAAVRRILRISLTPRLGSPLCYDTTQRISRISSQSKLAVIRMARQTEVRKPWAWPEDVDMAPILKSVDLPNQVQLPYVEQGDPAGVPVLLLHAIADSWHSFELKQIQPRPK